ncbi:GspH/FimT family pseudopilin [Psychromonas aquimarina]|uniref:GspH/FimT family pseudopilin n=1 Tax=Psychromonas aquimarina TaxID=444919 RepID=UPI000424A902|nr:GspH/FimT family protein [Psychromonas aquimarina]
MRSSKGFTLLEVLIVIAIISIVIAIALPSMQASTQRNRVDTAIAQIQKNLTFARNHSQNYLKYVTVCPLNNANKCTSDWKIGLDIFIDADKNLEFNGDDDDIKLKSGLPFNAQDTIVFTSPLTALTFRPDGQATVSAAPGTEILFRYCSGEQRSGLKVENSGITSIVEAANCS